MENRIIKFRAWDGTLKKFVNPTYNNTELSDLFELPFYHFSQFTGLTDCNGKEIWEGDIIKDTIVGAVSEIVFTDYANFGLKCASVKDLEYDVIDPAWTESSCKVIGNIFEHPELLNK